MSLHGKTALVTGSSKGIGRAIALRFAEKGADIVINYSRDKSAADEVQKAAEEYGVRAVSVQADVSRVPQIELLFQEALSAFGQIDVVVANAGIEEVNIPVADVREEDSDLLFRVNTKGPYFVLQAAARHMPPWYVNVESKAGH
ncbi:Glucose 1-dehydrogenase 2 [Streptomyces sp. YIM 121038]|uniref:SDR family NAD(P)-dependent oxidoreductase n=1 Tax=Streptomyces sp. YIM 121038 TaxID=2136401 RepID=UPI00111064E2|nr:Glucose 1-dehydrogenase 2 [Streptomyces sp. YIM 121038]